MTHEGTTCTRCGQHITNICTIDGKPYGTDCASKVLGIDVPKKFTGDAKAYKSRKSQDRDRSMTERGYLLDNVRKYWSDWVRVMAVYSAAFKSGSMASSWEMSFVDSIRTQLGMSVFEGIFNSNPDTYLEWYYDSSHARYYDLDFLPSLKPISSLSSKQMAIFENIESKILVNL